MTARVLLYDLVGTQDRRFSPNCWKTRMALAHKGLEHETRATRFTEIAAICGGGQRSVPVIEHGTEVVRDSWQIAEYLENTFPDTPSLFGPDPGHQFAYFFERWSVSLYLDVMQLIVKDIYDHVTPEDHDHFRSTRERILGETLEDSHALQQRRLQPMRDALKPARQVLQRQSFLAGDAPSYPDYQLFAILQWVRVMSPLPLVEQDDPIRAHMERCLDLFDGLARQTPAFDW
ncbi:MAG: glutathione S-transferase N-terminal domain-containing protein [Gammaproteobacteria bacterium]|nr:glutathione S-transferase N-terminal domain-containing protein [Gammaproteobacteria bacterium]